MNLTLRARIEHLVKVLRRRRLFLNAHGRKLLADAQRMLAEAPDDATIALAIRELTIEIQTQKAKP